MFCYCVFLRKRMASLSLIFLFALSVIFTNGWPSAKGKCTSNYDCRVNTYNKVCCSRNLDGNYINVCQSSCVGEKCSDDTDCGGPDEFCNTDTTRCEKSDFTTMKSGSGKVAPVIIVLAVLFFLIVGGGLLYRSCCRSSRRVVVVEEQPEESATAIISLRETPTYNNPAPLSHNNRPPHYNSQNYTACQPLQCLTSEVLLNCPFDF